MMNKRSIDQYASIYKGLRSGHLSPTIRPNSLPSGLLGAVSLRSIFMSMLGFFSLIWITISVYAGQNIVHRVGLYEKWNNGIVLSVISDGNKVLDSLVLKGFYNYTCPTKLNSTNIANIHICGNLDRTFHYKLIFVTTMYYSASNIHIFNNTLHVMASMRTNFNLLPVLFIENPRSFIDANATKFVQTACDLGWVVLLAPHCNHYGFPVFRAMFNISMANWDADWYGYSNGDMLFDETLFGSIDFIQSHTNILRVPLVIGRRFNSAITSTTQVGHYSEVKRLFRSSYLDSATAVDYFIMRKNFPWERVGDFVVGRPVYDTWLLWFASKLHLPMVDTTATVRAVHQVHRGRTRRQNTHKIRRVNDGMNYNKNLAHSIGKQDQSMTLVRRMGYISCIPLKLLQMQRADLIHLVAEGQTEIFGRGRRHFPVPGDDDEIRKMIDRERLKEEHQGESYEGMDMGESGAAITGAYEEADAYAESEEENKRAGNQSIHVLNLSNAQVQSTSGMKLLAAKGNKEGTSNLLNGTADNVKTEKLSNETKHVTQTNVNTMTINAPTHKPVMYASLDQPTPVSNILHMKTSIKPTSYGYTLFVKSSSNTTASKLTVTTLASTVRTNRRAASTKRATASQVKLPAMIPYVHKAEDYVYVLARRTRYLRRNKDGTKYEKVDYKPSCFRYNNVDLEIAELVTF